MIVALVNFCREKGLLLSFVNKFGRVLLATPYVMSCFVYTGVTNLSLYKHWPKLET
jgi:hypothetical protein